MIIKEDTPDIDSVEILLQYMDEFKHSGQNRAAAKLIRSLMASAPLVEAQNHISNAGKMVYEIKLITSLLGAAISDAEHSALRDVCIDVKNDLYRVIAQLIAVSDIKLHPTEQIEVFIKHFKSMGGYAVIIEMLTNYRSLVAGQVAPQATVEPLGIIRDALLAFSLTQNMLDYPTDHWSRRATAILAVPPVLPATVEPLTDEQIIQRCNPIMGPSTDNRLYALLVEQRGEYTVDITDDVIACVRACAQHHEYPAISKMLASGNKGFLATPPTIKATEPAAWGDAMRWAGCNPDYHGLIAFTGDQLKKFVSLVAPNLATSKATADGPEFTIEDSDLDTLLNYTADMLQGHGNMDVGLAWHASLETVLARLSTSKADTGEIRNAALEEAAAECDTDAEQYEREARGVDNSGASDHKAQAAHDLARVFRALKSATPSTIKAEPTGEQ